MHMKIKRLSREELAEGLTLALVNSIHLETKCSPVKLAANTVPVRLLICSAGYNVMEENGAFCRDDRNQLLVLSAREAQIGRARYLLNYGDKEKQTEVDNLVATWKENVRHELDKIKRKVDELKALTSEEKNITQTIFRAVTEQNDNDWNMIKNRLEAELREILPTYERSEAMYAENKFQELLTLFGIREFNNPIFSASIHNEQDIKILKNTFSKGALTKWDGDMLNIHARIEIEKRYPI